MSSYLTDRVPRDSKRDDTDWRQTLLGRLNVQAARVRRYSAYYDGDHPMQFATSKFKEAFGRLFETFADNWCQIVVDAPVERLKVVGFEVDGSPSDDAWELWQQNALDVESVIAHTEAGKCGQAYLLVDPSGDDGPRITVEHPSQMIVATDPGDRRKRVAALKRWKGDDGYVYLTLYLPDYVVKYESKEPNPIAQADNDGQVTTIDWVPRSGEESIADNPLGVVPVIPLVNKPGMLGPGHSDLESAVPIQNAVNKLCSDMLIASEYGAFPQRVVTGIEVPKDPETGRPLMSSDEMKSAMSRLWTFKPADAKVASLPAADLSNFVTAVEMFIQHLAAQTRTPPHYLLGTMVNTSGDALSVAEAGLVSKVRAKALFFSDGWEEALALALSSTGSEVKASDCEALWSNPERVSVGALVDAAVKKKSLGVPLPVLWAELGYTPKQIAEMEVLEKSKEEAELEAANAAAQAAVAVEAAKQTAEATGTTAPPTPPKVGGQEPPPPAKPTGGTGA